MTALKQLALKVKTWGSRLGDVKTPFAAYVKTEMRKSFDAQQTPNGVAWTPYAQSSLDRGRQPPLLVESGALRASLSVEAIPGAIQLGYTDSKAIFHNPTRPLLPTEMPPAWADHLRTLVSEALQ